MAGQLHVFVSHSHKDNAFCLQIVQSLRGAGADVWYDEDNLGWGHLKDVIIRELGIRPIFVLILSKAVFASRWVKREADWAEELTDREPSRVILPVTAGPIAREDFGYENGWLFLHGYKRIEAPGYKPYPVDEAANRLLRALALTPSGETSISTAPQVAESADVLLTRGKSLAAQNKFAEALPLFEQATRLETGSFDAWANRGYVLGELGRHEQAVDACDRALALDDRQAWVWSNKGAALGKLGRSQEELDACERAITLDQSLAMAWNNRGVALYRMKRLKESLASFDRALDLDLSIAKAWNNKAMALLGLRRYRAAISAVDRSLALNPDGGSSWDTKGQIFNARGAYQDGLLCLDRATRMNPNLGEAWANKAISLRGLGRDIEAETAEKRARALGWKQ